MLKLTFRNSHGQLVDIATVAATKVKNEFGAILEQTMHSGAVAITRHDTPKAVLLSFAEFESLVNERNRSLDDLNAEFDELLAHMQRPSARQGCCSCLSCFSGRIGTRRGQGCKKASPTAAKTDMNAPKLPRIHVLAGVNGAGKSSIGGAAVRQCGVNISIRTKRLAPSEKTIHASHKQTPIAQPGARVCGCSSGRLKRAWILPLRPPSAGIPSSVFLLKPRNKRLSYTSGT